MHPRPSPGRYNLRPSPIFHRPPQDASSHPKFPPRPPDHAQRTQGAYPAPSALQDRPLTPQALLRLTIPAASAPSGGWPTAQAPSPPLTGPACTPTEKEAAVCIRSNTPAPAPPSSQNQLVSRAARLLPGDFWDGSGSAPLPEYFAYDRGFPTDICVIFGGNNKRFLNLSE